MYSKLIGHKVLHGEKNKTSFVLENGGLSQNLMLVKVGFTVAGLTVFDIYGVVTNTMRSTVLSCEMVVVH